MKNDKNRKEGLKGIGGFEGILRGFSDIVEKLGELAEKGESLKRSGEFSWQGKDGAPKDLKGVYGFTVKVGAGNNDKIKVEPFGNIKRDEETGKSVVQEIREPMVDLFEEDDHILLVAEMPGVSAEDVKLDFKDDVLTITAEKKDKKYRKEIILPAGYEQAKSNISCNNGIIEIKCTR